MYFVQSNLFSTQGIKYYVYPLFINLDNSNWILHVLIRTTNYGMWRVLLFYYTLVSKYTVPEFTIIYVFMYFYEGVK